MKNNILVVALVVIIGVLSGVSLLFGIGNAVAVAVGPINMEVGAISATQRSIEKKLDAGGSGAVLTRLDAIENRLAAIEQKLNNRPADQPAAAPQPPQEDFTKAYTIEDGESAVLGKKDAPVTIVDFSDFQCPFCARFYPPIKEVMKAYPDKVRLIIKNFPLSFHPNARPAAKLALAANLQGKYFEMADQLFDNGGDVSDAKIKEYAKTLGLNYNKLMDDYKNKDAEWEKRIQTDIDLGSKVDVRGTPTFYINGHKTMARDFNAYKAEIDKVLAEAGK